MPLRGAVGKTQGFSAQWLVLWILHKWKFLASVMPDIILGDGRNPHCPEDECKVTFKQMRYSLHLNSISHVGETATCDAQGTGRPPVVLLQRWVFPGLSQRLCGSRWGGLPEQETGPDDHDVCSQPGASSSPMFSWEYLLLTQGKMYQVSNCQVLGIGAGKGSIQGAEEPGAPYSLPGISFFFSFGFSIE